MTEPAPPRRRKLSARWNAIITPFLLSVFMTFIVTGITTFRAIGFAPNFFATWLTAWPIAIAISVPVTTVMLPIVRTITALFVER